MPGTVARGGRYVVAHGDRFDLRDLPTGRSGSGRTPGGARRTGLAFRLCPATHGSA